MTDKEGTIYEKATIAFQKLDVQPGNIVVVHFPADIEHEQMNEVAQQLRPALPPKVVVLCVRAGVTIEALSEVYMNKLGWFKFNPQQLN